MDAVHISFYLATWSTCTSCLPPKIASCSLIANRVREDHASHMPCPSSIIKTSSCSKYHTSHLHPSTRLAHITRLPDRRQPARIITSACSHGRPISQLPSVDESSDVVASEAGVEAVEPGFLLHGVPWLVWLGDGHSAWSLHYLVQWCRVWIAGRTRHDLRWLLLQHAVLVSRVLLRRMERVPLVSRLLPDCELRILPAIERW